jgi:hypothetical protein
MKNYITFAVLGSDDSQLGTLPHRKSLIMTTYCYQELTSERSLRRSVGSKMLCTNPGRSTSVSSYFLMKGCDINCTQLKSVKKSGTSEYHANTNIIEAVTWNTT